MPCTLPLTDAQPALFRQPAPAGHSHGTPG